MIKYVSTPVLWLARLIRCLYFRRCEISGESVSQRPTVFLASHRNGAVDGIVYAAVLGAVPSLVSVQLLRSPFLRVFFDGIAVVREKDSVRYGIDAADYPSPLKAAVEQVRLGGSVCVFPEGTSEWQCAPQVYQRGMAVMVAKLNALGVDFDVQPIGVFYSRPDGFRSRVSLVLGKAFRPPAVSVAALQEYLAEALNQVSVNCKDNQHFNAVQAQAWCAAQQGQVYGEAFLQAQGGAVQAVECVGKSVGRVWARVLCYVGFPLPSLAAFWAQGLADGRNTMSFLKIVAAFYALWLQALLYAVLWGYAPLFAVLGLAVGVLGFCFYPEPEPVVL